MEFYLNSLKKGDVITLERKENKEVKEIFYITEEETDNISEIGFYINEYNKNYTCEDDMWNQYKISENEAIEELNKLLFK